MKARGVVVSMVLGIGLTILPAAAHALRVVIGTNGTSQQFFLNTEGSTLNLDCPGEGGDTSGCASTALGSPKTYTFNNGAVFTIAKCAGAGCSGGRARVFVSDGAVDTLVLTDAVIRNAGTVDATLTLRIDSDPYTTAGEPGPRAYAAELSGSFVPALINPFNRVRVRALACFDDGEGISCSGEGSRVIDSPNLDPGETSPNQYSIIAPPYKPAGTSQFSPKEQDSKFCPDFGDVCIPALRLEVEIQLKVGYSVRLPGSIGAAGTKDICDPNTPDDPARQKGCTAMAAYFASLGPKGAEMYEVRLEPSPGSDSSLNIRGNWNSADRWTASRSDDDEKQGGILGASKVRAMLETNGTGEVKAHGLCSVPNGCEATALPVRVYCGTDLVFTAALSLNHKGDGRVDLISTTPVPGSGSADHGPVQQRVGSRSVGAVTAGSRRESRAWRATS